MKLSALSAPERGRSGVRVAFPVPIAFGVEASVRGTVLPLARREGVGVRLVSLSRMRRDREADLCVRRMRLWLE